MSKRVSCGFEIQALPARLIGGFGDPPVVRLFKMGSSCDAVYLTPDEADALSDALALAASDARIDASTLP